MDFGLDDLGDDFATLVVTLGEDDGATVLLDGRGSQLRLPLYRHESERLIALLQEVPVEDGPWPPEGVCILTGAEGEEAEDCCTHRHEKSKGK